MQYIGIRRGSAKTDMAHVLYTILCGGYISVSKWCKNVRYTTICEKNNLLEDRRNHQLYKENQ